MKTLEIRGPGFLPLLYATLLPFAKQPILSEIEHNALKFWLELEGLFAEVVKLVWHDTILRAPSKWYHAAPISGRRY